MRIIDTNPEEVVTLAINLPMEQPLGPAAMSNIGRKIGGEITLCFTSVVLHLQILQFSVWADKES